MKRKSPASAAKASGKGKAAPAKVQPRGGASGAKKKPTGLNKKTEKGMQETFEAWLGRLGLRPEAEARVRKKWPAYWSKVVEELAVIRAEKTAELASRPPAAQAQLKKAYRRGYIDGMTFAKAKRASKQFKTSRNGLDAARVELAELEAGVDIAADIAAKHFPRLSKKRAKDANAEERFELSQALEDLGWWLSQVPAGSKEARWRSILLGNFNSQDRYSFESRSAHRFLLSDATAAHLIKTINAKLESAPDDAERISSIIAILKTKQEAVRAFLERFFQRMNGNRAESLRRRQKTAEALAQRSEPPRLVGKTKEQVSKTRENDLCWIRTKKRTP